MYKDNTNIRRGMYSGVNVPVKTLDIMIPVMIAVLAAVIIYLSVNGGYTVTFTDGETTQSYYKLKYGESVTEPQDMSREGYVFDGWYTDADYTSEWNFSSDHIKNNTVLYAKWDKAGAISAESRKK